MSGVLDLLGFWAAADSLRERDIIVADHLRRAVEGLVVEERHHQAAATQAVYSHGNSPFGGPAHNYTLTAYVPTHETAVQDYHEFAYHRTFECSAFVTVAEDAPAFWVVRLIDLDPTGSRWWPRVPSLAHAIAFIEQRRELLRGVSSPLGAHWLLAHPAYLTAQGRA